jgi:ABC-2 type transport system ATP-binding protein
MEQPALQLWGVKKRYGLLRKHEALSGVSLSVAPGECFGLAGPNGAGKTTLIKLLLGLAQPDDGEVRLFGERPDDPEVRRRVGFVPESAELPPSASPRALVRRVARLRGLALEKFVPRGLQQLERMGLEGLLDRPAGKLSKGEKQRTLLALALLPDPELLVLDEPTDGLDPMGRALVRRVLREEIARGRTVFLNSHLLSETERVCTRVAILHKGRVVREEAIGDLRESTGSTAVVLQTPLSEEALRTVGARAAPSLQGKITESAGATVLVDHDGLEALNAALDRLRAQGALIGEVRRVRPDLEATFEAAVTGAPQTISHVDPPPPAPEPRASLLRGPRSVARVAGEIAADLAARKIGWVALGAALLFLGLFLWVLHNEVVSGAAAVARQWGGPDGLTDAAGLGHAIGRYVGTTVYWSIVPGSILFAALFAPPLLDPRRSVLILSQPVSRADLAAGIYAAVCALVLAEFVFISALLFGGLLFLDLRVDAGFLLIPLPMLFAFAAIYAVQLAFTYLVRSGPAAAAVGLLLFIAAAILGFSDGARPGAKVSAASVSAAFLPRVRSLSQQAMRLGAGELPALAPFVLTGLFIAAFSLVAAHAAQRSEQ